MKTIDLSPNRRRRDWFFTTLFCLSVAVVTFTIWGRSWYVHVIISLGFGYSALICSYLLERFFPAIDSKTEIMVSLTGSIIFGSINAWILLEGVIGGSKTGLLPVTMLGALFSAICFFYFYNREQKNLANMQLTEAQRKQTEQEKMLILSQLRQMQSQIEPHFLFNTLANISALMDQDVPKARMMLDKLTELLRTTLANSRQSTTEIKSEIRLIQAYLAIQKVRLDERLNYHIDFDAALDAIAIPPMLVQPLIENAIKHGIEPKRAGGTIWLSIRKIQNQLSIQVKDDGVGIQTTQHSQQQNQGHGMALNNIKQRVKALYENLGSVSITQPENGGFCVTILIPVQQEL